MNDQMGPVDDVVDESSERTDRRALLKRAGLLGTAAVAGGLALPGAVVDAGATNSRLRVLDVACDNRTFAIMPSTSELTPAEGFPPQGTSFYVEGAVFRTGIIRRGEVFDYDGNLDRALGHWFCVGWFTSIGGRVDPHVLTTQTYLLGRITQEQPFPRHQMQSYGTEGAFGPAPGWRSIIGGSGNYAGVSGEARQRVTGENNTVDPFGFPGPNFRFNFHYA